MSCFCRGFLGTCGGVNCNGAISSGSDGGVGVGVGVDCIVSAACEGLRCGFLGTFGSDVRKGLVVSGDELLELEARSVLLNDPCDNRKLLLSIRSIDNRTILFIVSPI